MTWIVVAQLLAFSHDHLDRAGHDAEVLGDRVGNGHVGGLDTKTPSRPPLSRKERETTLTPCPSPRGRGESLSLDGNLALARPEAMTEEPETRATSGFDDFQVRLPRPVMSPTEFAVLVADDLQLIGLARPQGNIARLDGDLVDFHVRRHHDLQGHRRGHALELGGDVGRAGAEPDQLAVFGGQDRAWTPASACAEGPFS